MSSDFNGDWTPFYATGVKVPSGQKAPVRKDIRNLSPEELYLYVEGLARFQQESSTKPKSFYQIAGLSEVYF